MKKKSGYSLLEVLLAFAILSVAIIPILSMYPTVFKITWRAGENEELSRLSLTVVDYIKSRGYDSIMNNTNLFSDETDDSYEGNYQLESANIQDSKTYTSSSFENTFGIPNEFFLLSSKGLDLSQLKINIKLKKRYFNIEGGDYYNSITGTNSSAFQFEILTTMSKKTESKYIDATVTLTEGNRAYTISFVISPLENWSN